MTTNRVILVPAEFLPVGKMKKNGTEFHRTGWSDSMVDAKKLTVDLDNAIRDLNRDGYRVISITPITSGDHIEVSGAEAGYGSGFSYTDSLVVLAEREE